MAQSVESVLGPHRHLAGGQSPENALSAIVRAPNLSRTSPNSEQTFTVRERSSRPATGDPNASQNRKERRSLDGNPLPPRNPKCNGSGQRGRPLRSLPSLRHRRIRPCSRFLGRRRRLLLRMGPETRRSPLGRRSAEPVRFPRRRRAAHGRHGTRAGWSSPNR